MAPSFFCPLPTIKTDRLEELYTVHGMCPNFLRHLLALLVKAREEGLLFGLDEDVTSYMVSRIVIRTGEKSFFVFKIDEASVGNFDFSRLPCYWAEDIGFNLRSLERRSNWSSFDRSRIRAAFLMPGGSGVTPKIVGSSKDEVEHSQEEVEASSSNHPLSDRLERQLSRRSLFRTSRSVLAGKASSRLPPIPIPDSDDEGSPEGRRPHVPLSSGLQDNSVDASRKRRLSSKVVMQEPSRSKRESKDRKFILEGDGPLSMGQDDLVSLARRTRFVGCRPPSLGSPEEEGAYAKIVVASSKGDFLFWIVLSDASRRRGFVEVFSLRIRVDGSAEVVPSSLSYWVTEPRLLKSSRSRWSSILRGWMTHRWNSRSWLPRRRLVSFSSVSSVFREFPFGLIQSVSDGPIGDLLVVAPKKKGRIVGIGSVNEVARATSSYTSRRDEETAQMKARMDSQQVRLDSLEDLLDVMAVGNPVMQRMLSERRAALGMPARDPQESDPTRQQPSNPTNYFENM
ncbi:hypothetical protein DY000_02041256 [Brassica cretica]|uniref:DUF4283 domain-containing protein n=2 Tax=Brassica cretica TaxID=69181 RepID=A0ABQ7BQ02_BRACR|nr:hypothetical protein DY000_02041256 [Brassica cretica]